MGTAETRLAREIMQRGVVAVSPELSLLELEELLTGEDISGAPVTDTDGRVIGIVSKTDVVRYYSDAYQAYRGDETWPGSDGTTTVSDIMTEELVTVPPSATLMDVARVMVDGRLHRVIVGDVDSIEGILTSLDLLGALVQERS
jgi:CBS domain-containing protein